MSEPKITATELREERQKLEANLVRVINKEIKQFHKTTGFFPHELSATLSVVVTGEGSFPSVFSLGVSVKP